MNRRKLITILLALVFVACAGRVAYHLLQYRQGDQLNAQAEALAKLPETLPAPQPLPEEPEDPSLPPAVQTLLELDLAALREVNSAVLGWISIPDTPVSYPMVQGEDNQYYLERAWDKTPNAAGSIFLDWHVSSDFSGFNTIIYGHRMRNNSMFGSLKHYKDADYRAAHPNLYITTEEGVSRYQVFAAYEVSVLGDTYRMDFPDEASRQSFLDFCVSQSVIGTDIVPTVEDQVVTLSTCTGNGYSKRWVVQAVLAETYPVP